MPGLPSAQSGLQGAFNDQVVHANTTLNSFVGGKQKAWMLNASPVQPSRRPPPPRPQQAQDQTSQLPTTPANVLPSPAPSEEPSPAVSNPRDSPNPRTLSVTTAPQRQTARQVQTVQPAGLADLPSRSGDTAQTLTEAVAEGPDRPPTTDNAMADRPVQSLQSPVVMAPPDLPHVYHTGPVTDASKATGPVLIDLESPTSHLPPVLDGGGHPNKRRRVETSSPLVGVQDTPVSDLTAFIDARIAQKGGIEALKPDVERPRFQILRDACDRKDNFYITLHQLYCLWSIDHQIASNLPLCDPESVRIGFGILESVLKKNAGFSKSNLLWCARFPGRSLEPHRNPTVNQVAAFLSSLSQHWTSLHDNLFNRLYPYLMDELVGKLQCYSTVLQKILFTAARRRLGVSDGPLGLEIDNYFVQDQEDHFINGQYRTFVSPNDPDGLEQRNAPLIQCYRRIMSKAKAEQQLLEQKQQQSSQQQQHLQQQQQQQNFQQQQHIQQQNRHLQQQQQTQVLQQRQAMLHQQFSQQHQVQRMQTQSPYPAFIQQHVPSPSASHIDGQYEQNRVLLSNHVRRASRQNSRPMSSPRISTMPSQIATHHAIGSSPTITGSGCSPSATRRQANEIPQNMILPSSSTTVPVSVSSITQSIPSPQAYMQGLPSPQQYNVNYQAPTQNMQNPQYGNLYAHQIAPAHHGNMHQQWSRGMNSSPMSPGQVMSSTQYMATLRSSAPQPNGAPTMARTPILRQVNQNSSSTANWYRPLSTFIPRPGQTIERSDHPHSHHERKSLMMSLHQAHARSPDRTRRIGEKEERYYQSVRSFAIEPFRLEHYHPSLEIVVTPEEFSLLYKEKHLPLIGGQNAALAVREYSNGSLRYRLRCCQVNSDRPVTESEWVTKETSWPDHIFPHFNQQKLVVRRGTHHGKDLPVELTDFVVPGVNKLKVAMTSAAPHKKPRRFQMAVEILETHSHSQVLKHVWANGLADREETMEKIRKRVNAVPEEDGIAVIDRTGTTTSELSIDLTDPFSASIFAVPARGVTCTHMECFDLETWLNTRPTKQAIRCGHQKVCTCPKYAEPSDPDKWKCPICFADARPRSLRIDRFLLDVRRRLEELNKLDTKSILVSVDGTWRPVAELVDDDDAGSDGDGPANRGPVAALRKEPSKSASVERAVEVIEID